ncbi:Vesicle transport v-SNARE 12 [Linum perenne]
MDLEAMSLQPSAKAMLLAKLREYKSDMTKLNREFKGISSGNQAAHPELLNSGSANSNPVMGFLVSDLVMMHYYLSDTCSICNI